MKPNENEAARMSEHEGADGLSRRNFIHAGAGLVSIAAAGGLLAACGDSDSDSSGSGSSGSGSSEDIVFGFSHPFAEVPTVASVKKIVKELAENEGWKVLLDETQGGKVQDQQAVLETWITQKVTAINLFPPEPSNYEAIANRAIDAGIIWTTYATPMTVGAGGALLPGAASGEVTGKATVDWINKNDPTAKVLILRPPEAGAEILKRVEVPQKMIEEQTQAKIVAVQRALDQPTGLQVTEDVLQANPDLTVVIGLNDDAALGAAEAFRKQGKPAPDKVWIIGQDGAVPALTALKNPDSYFRATAALDIHKLCVETVGVTKRAIERKWKPGDPQESVDIAPTLVTAGDTKAIEPLIKAQS